MLKTLTALTVAVAVAAAVAAPGAALAEGRNCGDRNAIVQRLENNYGEARTGAGLSDGNSSMIEIFASEETGTWTILLTRPDGQSCLVAAGDNWQGGIEALAANGQPV